MSKTYTEKQLREAYFQGAVDCHDKCTNRSWKGIELEVNTIKLEQCYNKFLESLNSVKPLNNETTQI